MFKRLIKAVARHLGYRVVPLDRDADSFLRFLVSQPIKTVVDVGASNGKTVEEWLARYPNAKVYGIEPLPQSFALLKELEVKFGDRVEALNCAVGETVGVSKMHFHADHPTSSSLLSSTSVGVEALPIMERETVIEVEETTLDLIFSRRPKLEGPVLLKMDVQGFEARVLRGATNFLRSVAYVLTEITIADCYEDQCEFDELHRILAGEGFKLMGFLEQFHLKDGSPIYADVVYVNANYAAGKMNA